MVRTIFRSFLIFLLLQINFLLPQSSFFLPQSSFFLPQSNSFLPKREFLLLHGNSVCYAADDQTKWVNGATSAAFVQKPLHGQVDGIDFLPVVAEEIFQRTGLSGGAPGHPDSVDKITFKDGGGRQIDVAIYGLSKFENVTFAQSSLVQLKGAARLTVESDLHALPLDEFAIRLSLGKILSDKKRPIYIVFRNSKNNWMEGYIYAQVHERTMF